MSPAFRQSPLLDRRIPGARQLLGRLVDAHKPQEVIFEHEQIQHNTLCMPRDGNHACARDSVEYEVVGGGNNGCQDETRVGHAANDQSQPLPAAELDGHRGHRESDEERVTEVEGWHGRCCHRKSA